MKKRDFYILGLLFCIVVYAAFHRKTSIGNDSVVHKEMLVPKANSGIENTKIDSVNIKAKQITNAEI